MKRVLTATVTTCIVAFLLASCAITNSPGAAGSEPLLASDGSLILTAQEVCVIGDKDILMRTYERKYADELELIFTTSVNGQKVEQNSFILRANMLPTHTRSVRNTPGGNWITYKEDEDSAAAERFFAEIGLTAQELSTCLDEQ